MGLALLAAILAALVAAAAELSLGRPAVDARRLVVLVHASASMNARGPEEEKGDSPHLCAAGHRAKLGRGPFRQMAPRGTRSPFSAPQTGQSNLQRARLAAVELIESLGARTEVAVAEAAGALRLVAPFQPAGREAARAVASIEPFDGPADLPAAMQQAFDLWGESEDCEIYVFTDAPLPESGWGRRAHAWIAPPAGDNRGIVALSAQRQGKKILAEFTLANYAARPQKLTGTVLVNGVPRRAFAMPPLDPGESRRRQVAVDEPEAASLVVRLDGPPDALAVDDEACIRVPALEDLRVRVAWPAGAKHNAYVAALLATRWRSKGSLARSPLATLRSQSG